MDRLPFARRQLSRLGGALAAGVVLFLGAPALPGRAQPTAGLAQPAEAAIGIDNFTFMPPLLTVSAGTRVVWTNRDDIPHTVVSVEDPRGLRSPPLDIDDSFAFTFAVPGTYHYFCSLHPHMQGTVVVR